MKKIKSIQLVVILMITIFGCKKLSDPAGQRGVAIVPAISNVQPGIFDSKDLVNSYVQFTISLPSGTQVDAAFVEASYNSDSERKKVADITTFPSTVKLISGAVINSLGINPANVQNGDVFTIEVLTTLNGVTTRSNAIISVSVACAFDKTQAVGSYHSVSTDWGTNGNITLTGDLSDPYTIYVVGLEALEGVVEDKGPLVMHIDPNTYAVTAPKKVIGSNAFGYHNIAYSGTGTYNSCDGSYAMVFEITVDEGSFGLNKFTFTRNP